MLDTRVEVDALALQEQMVALVRGFGWHRPDRTPCGQPVPISEAHALMELARTETLPQSELGARLGLEKSTVSRLVGQLDARGWLARGRSGEDGRVMLVGLSPAGRRAAEQLASARAALFARLLERIPAERREGVLESLSALVEAVREI
ncbi:MAG TPA: MarR family transcriptional regulator [Chloroflexota bacterium]|nr:MarR family transcriptional regulator [Chloroflexota bacterium]